MAAKRNAVLVVEDDVDMRELVECTLTDAGYRVMTAREGQEALEQVAQEMPGAIVLDLRMPGMDGWEFAREFRARYSRSTPILVLTASQSAAESAAEIGAEAFLDKPFEIDELIRLVQAICVQPAEVVTEEESWVSDAKRGNQEAFMKLYDRYYDRIFRHISYRTNRVEDAEDLTQQVFFQAWSALGRYEQRGAPFPAWLFTIAHNLLVNSYRQKAAPSVIKEDIPDYRADSDPERQAYLRMERERILAAIRKLTAVQQQVVTMRFLDNVDYHTIAAVVGKSEVNVRVIQYRALQQLRRLLQEEER